MANKLFKTIKELDSYIDERFVIDLADIRPRCRILNSLLKPERKELYRIGKQRPMIIEGDVIILKDKGEAREGYFLNKPTALAEDKPVFTLEDVFGDMVEVYSKESENVVMLPVSKSAKSRYFTMRSPISSNFASAVHCLLSKTMVEFVGAELAVDASRTYDGFFGLGNFCNLPKSGADGAKEACIQRLYEEQMATNVRRELTPEEIDDEIVRYTEEYARFINLIQSELITAIGPEFEDFVEKDLYCRYSFDQDNNLFFIDRGLDFRLYNAEYDRITKMIDENPDEDIVGTFVRNDPTPKFSMRYVIPR